MVSGSTATLQGHPATRVGLLAASGSLWRRYGAALRSLTAASAAAAGLLALAGWLGPLFGLRQPFADALAIAGALAGGGVIAAGAVRGLLARQFNVDELVLLALLASLATGEYLSAALVVFMMLGGKLLEDLTAHRATAAIEALGALLPDVARVRAADGECPRPVGELAPGDRVIVRPGERIAVDGVIEAGEAAVDQSPLTGESAPVPRRPAQRVLAGSLVLEGALEIRTTAAGRSTTLGAVAQLAATALSDRAPVVRVADRYARYVTPAVLGLAALTFLLTRELSNAVAVLVVACPCVLVMATPTAVVAGVAAGARRGLLIRGGARLEAAARVDTVAFDKTGTLTTGRPAVTRVLPTPGFGRAELLCAAAAAERLSEHPLAGAVLAQARLEGALPATGLDAGAFRSYPGRGVAAVSEGCAVVVGSRELLGELGIGVPAGTVATMGEVERAGETAVLVALDGRVAGVIATADAPRAGAQEMIAALRRAGVRRTLMLTGDAPPVAAAVARAVGIDEVHAGLLPQEKVAQIQRLRAEGHRVAMVGDGVNDAPALAVADVAVAAGAGATDVARHTADVVILSDDVFRALEVFLLSRRTLATIRQNLALAAAWNVLALAAAATGVLSPVAGALVHNAGSVLVVLNAARLAGWSPRHHRV